MADRPPRPRDEHSVRLRFEIRGKSPTAVPVARLARYLGHLATVPGKTQRISLVGIGEGSLRLDFEANPEAVDGIRTRAAGLLDGTASANAFKALRALRHDLGDDGVRRGDLVTADGENFLEVVPPAVETELGPIAQWSSVDGIPIVVGGQNDPVPVHLQAADQVVHGRADRKLARQLVAHLFDTPVRASGEGRWLRDRHGTWVVKSFRIRTFERLSDDSLHEVTARLRAIEAAWKKAPDPLGELVSFRESDG